MRKRKRAPGGGRKPKRLSGKGVRLADALSGAESSGDLLVALQRVAQAALSGELKREDARTLIEIAKEVRQVLKVKAKEPGPDPLVEAIEIITPQQQEALARYNASVTVPPLQPGETPPPPPLEEAPPA